MQGVICLAYAVGTLSKGHPLLLFMLVAVVGCDGAPSLSLGITTAEHDGYFPISGTAPHALGVVARTGLPISCEGCHGGTDSFRVALCIGCHQLDAVPLPVAHGGVAGFELVDTSCLACHETGLRGSEVGVGDHSARRFPIDADDVHGGPAYLARIGTESSCNACHPAANRFTPLCAECHAADTTPLAITHQGVIRTFVNDSVKCKECHADTPINPAVRPVSNHDLLFPVNHHAAKCTDCHSSHRPVPQAWAIDFAVALCTKCHIAACTQGNQGACN